MFITLLDSDIFWHVENVRRVIKLVGERVDCQIELGKRVHIKTLELTRNARNQSILRTSPVLSPVLLKHNYSVVSLLVQVCCVDHELLL